MASFSFGAGNARQLASIPLYALGRLGTLLIPRRPGTWVFGCGVGIGDGALALWDVVVAEGHPAIWLVGSAREERDAASRGIPSVRKGSIRGFWCTARAGIVVVTHGFGDVNRYAVSGAYIVQLWHGIPLKRIGLDSPETVRSGILPGSRLVRAAIARMYRSAARRIDLLPAASHLVRGRLESAFGLPDSHVPVSGEPRVDVLSRGTADTRRSQARAAIEAATRPMGAAARLVLYAPTWRDGAPDPAVPTAEEWTAIVDVLARHDAVLLVRSHPLGAGDYSPPFQTERVLGLGSDAVIDVTPLLPALEALVTDYSSLAFDAALVPVPVVFLAPDVDAYGRSRGFYGAYADVAGEGWARDWREAAAQLDSLLGDENARAARVKQAERLSERVHAFRDGKNTGRVYRAILAGSSATKPRGSTARSVTKGIR
ncbi:CDP-glycerol glycerophosphotransferase family protein [Microbacterium sp.]|uniref:CDP-glycerol glycerophosphotransferase family protein n=1 Tax=Microbacterium sp. TaxID=51671 RepID=UPI002E313D54|nr:CDP-glycerol glycerophosphotransferase family protein [Microbacterium sp.]HEX5727799.1 CDP-glycerol glycerophosphotransferase family protein [Microbacterium sp.]